MLLVDTQGLAEAGHLSTKLAKLLLQHLDFGGGIWMGERKKAYQSYVS